MAVECKYQQPFGETESWTAPLSICILAGLRCDCSLIRKVFFSTVWLGSVKDVENYCIFAQRKVLCTDSPQSCAVISQVTCFLDLRTHNLGLTTTKKHGIPVVCSKSGLLESSIDTLPGIAITITKTSDSSVGPYDPTSQPHAPRLISPPLQL